jgi:Leucine-rich repeat (LRR) protein
MEIFFLPVVCLLSPLVIIHDMYVGVRSAWESTESDFFSNPVSVQTNVFFATTSQIFEAFTESAPELAIQTRVFMLGLLEPSLYFQSAILSGVSIAKAVFLLFTMYGSLLWTAKRLTWVITSSEIISALGKPCPNLMTLDLGGTNITDEGLKAVAEHCPNLTDLRLAGTKITDEGAKAVAEHCPNLKLIT